MARKKNTPAMHVLLLVALLVVLTLNLYYSSSINLEISSEKSELEEKSIPAELELIIIESNACTDCTSAEDSVGAIKSRNVKITKEKTLQFSDKEAQNLIKKYEIEKLPTVIVTGEIEKTGNMGLSKVDDALIKTQVAVPFADPKTGKARGFVDIVTISDSTCKDCADLSTVGDSFKQAGLRIQDIIDVEVSSKKGKEYVTKYGLTEVPALLLQGDPDAYPDIKDAMLQVGKFTSDGTYVITTPTPPFRDLKTKKIVGLVSMTILTDKTCKNCYNTSLHNDILSRLGMIFSTEEEVDVSSTKGKALIKKYSIETVPTIILSEDAKVYSLFDQIWAQVGSAEEDGKFVFRRNDALGTEVYKDLATGEETSGSAAAE